MRILRVVLFFLVGVLNAQTGDIPTGFWRTHLSYYNVREVEKYGNKIFALSDGNIFTIDVKEKEIASFDKVQGLNDVEISTIKYHPSMKVLLIGYQNGNIDILQDNIVYNIDAIKNSNNIFGSKEIFDIYPYKEFAYLSTGVGLILLDVSRLEIKESYTDIGYDGDRVATFSTTVNNRLNKIFTASAIGVISATRSSSVNLKDYNNWHVYDSPNDSVNGKGIVGLVTFKDTTYAATTNGKIFYFDQGGWLEYGIPLSGFGELRKVVVYGGKMIVVFPNDLMIINDRSDYEVVNYPFSNIFDAGIEGPHTYTAEVWAGVRHDFYGYQQNDIKNGPFQETSFHLMYYDDKIVSCAGGYSKQTYSPNYFDLGYNEFYDNVWRYHAPSEFPVPLKDLVASEYNYNDGSLYFASYYKGLLRRKPDGSFQLYDENNSPLTPLSPGSVWLTDVEMDNQGGLWVANVAPGIGNNSLHVLRANGSWDSYSFPIYPGSRPVDIVIDDNNTKWIMPGGTGGANGLIAFNENGNNYKYLSSKAGAGGLPNSDVKSIIVDKTNQVWVGTTQGVAVFYNPESVFTSPYYEAERPIYDNRPLLREEVITAIEVDGGNRKWIGTTNGLWLFNPTGTELISFFNTENSPLFSNNILDIEIHDLTGEVYISTDAGLISYRGTSTEGKEQFEDVEIFPNPIETNKGAILTISGLVENANVKITDISGHLMYETQANGGTAIWNLRDYNDVVAKTGVYMIFAASLDGEEGFVGKVALIRK